MPARSPALIAEEAEFALRGLDIDQLNDRAGYRPGVDLVDLLPEWDAVLRSQGHLRERRSA